MDEVSVDTACPRAEALHIMEASLSAEERARNLRFVNNLKEIVYQHPLNEHSMLQTLYSGSISLVDIQKIHLEYRASIVKIFTDALAMAVFNAKDLEPRLAPGSKMAARYLLTLNCLDEYGFKGAVNGVYIGSPAYAHYPLYEGVLEQLGLSREYIDEYDLAKSSIELKEFLETSYDSYSINLALIAVAEVQVILFSPALRSSMSMNGIDVSNGYYQVHGTSSDIDCDAADDEHENDLWLALIQSITPAEFDYVERSIKKYLDLWCAFWDERQRAISESDQTYLDVGSTSCDVYIA